MRHLVIVFLSLLTFYCKAQNNNSFIEVTGETSYKNEIEKYQSKITMTANEYYVYEEDKATLENIEEIFFSVMEKNGFSRNEFVESDDVPFDDNIKQSIYVFETSSKERFVKFNRLKNTKGTSKYDKKVVYKPFDQRKKIIAQALDSARENAIDIAKAMGKKLGKISSVSDVYNNFYTDSYYPEKETTRYRLVVRFELE
ncbi:hypothetical protein GCM10023231_12060 [Olivibacter ginsenosidimutans]|uniref:DUF541 domain-containing protein n=1 Tax=Olivibacter ginsenosidimutans TaxID=1176537 RepID=A0ABP9ATP2_9SPHI